MAARLMKIYRNAMAASKGPGLYEFLTEAELQQYYSSFKNDLKIQNVPQLKYVVDEDLVAIGLTKPEIRRLKKFFQRHYPQNYLLKFKKLILSKREDNHDTFLSISAEVPDRPNIKVPNKHIIPAENIVVNKQLGQGEFGIVQQGVWTDEDERIQVAIKCLSRERMQNNPIEFLKEAAIMHGIDHEHIVRLHGVVLDTDSLMLVTELAPLRSLLECLKEPSLRSSFPVLTLCDFAVQICDGMQYLEQKRLIHRDLAARNILVFSKNKVKISDFGLSRALGVGKDYYQTNFNVNLKLPIAWCAPECISYLRFTSASDVWAYGVTLWEMFSYGFQPWAALTGQQILEAIDEPSLQRLEQPECCPREYFLLMLKCWAHDPNKRPRFADLISLLPECKPEQVQTVEEFQEDSSRSRRDQLAYRVGDIITVLDRQHNSAVWKGVLANGKTGLFNPAHTVTYLGNNLPSTKSEFVRGDGRNTYSSKRRIRPDMISGPQGDFKHTGHVGLDGAYFGDLSFLGGRTPSLPRQVVAPYKPHEDVGSVNDLCRGSDSSDCTPLLTKPIPENEWADNNRAVLDHEYLEISDDEEAMGPTKGRPNGGTSPVFKKNFDLGPSLMDEMESMLRGFGSPMPTPQHAPPPADRRKPPPFQLPAGSTATPPASPLAEAINVKNEMKEFAAKVAGGKKKQATVKPISASEERNLEHAIAMVNEMTARSISDFDGNTPPESPHTPASPSKRKLFRFPSVQRNSHRNDNRNFSEPPPQIHDIQAIITPEAKQVYSSLVEQASSFDSAVIATARASVPAYGRQPLTCFSTFGPGRETNPLRMVRAGVVPMARAKPRTMSEPQPQRDDENALPLPPRPSKLTLENLPRHRRKHPLIIPGVGFIVDSLSPSEDHNDVFLPSTPEATETQPAFPPTSDADDIFEQQIATELDALDELDGESPRAEHVSCEDLLAFSTQAQAKSRGPDSDQVRIMTKVLGKDTTAELCLSALDITNWDVHGAIKLVRLRQVVRSCPRVPELQECWSTLNASQGDVARAASLLLNNESPPDFV